MPSRIPSASLTRLRALHTMHLGHPSQRMNKPVFYDPQRKRWKRLRRIFDVLALLGAFLGAVFIVGLLTIKPLPELRLTSQTRNYKALASPPKPVAKPGAKPAL